MRLLSVIRLSVDTDETTSPARQRAKNQAYADLNDHTIIGEAQDLDVSARKVDPWHRPDLGPWLTDAGKLAHYDGLIFAKQDRIARSSLDWHKLVKWLPEHDKTMICLNPMADLTTIAGRFTAGIMAQFGEMEADMIAERVKDSYDALHAAGQYAGGQVPFGYRPVRLAKGWGYEPDPVYGPIVREMADRLLGGWSQSQIATWLNETGVPTSRNVVRLRNNKPVRPSEWKATSVKKILSSPATTGTMMSGGAILRGIDGMPIQRAEPLIDHDIFELVQERLQDNSGRTGPRSNGAPLLRVAFCGSCGSVMHLSAAKPYQYYMCQAARQGKCTERRFPAKVIEAKLAAMILAEVGDRKMTRRQVTAANDNSEEIAQTRTSIEAWEAKAVLGESADNVLRILDGLNTRLTELTKAQRPGGVSWVETSETVREHLGKLTEQDLNAFLRDRGVTIHVRHNEDGTVHGELHLGDLDSMATA